MMLEPSEDIEVIELADAAAEEEEITGNNDNSSTDGNDAVLEDVPDTVEYSQSGAILPPAETTTITAPSSEQIEVTSHVSNVLEGVDTAEAEQAVADVGVIVKALRVILILACTTLGVRLKNFVIQNVNQTHLTWLRVTLKHKLSWLRIHYNASVKWCRPYYEKYAAPLVNSHGKSEVYQISVLQIKVAVN